MPQALRAGVVGAGFIAAVHARSARLAGARLAGVSASTAQRAAEAATALRADHAYRSSEDLVSSPDIDVVHICAPNHLHAPLAKAALAAGKHVVCEKPLALDAESAAEVVDAARAARRVAAVPFVYRFYPTVREARERVRSGATGRVNLVHGTYLQDWLLHPGDDNWRVDTALGGASRAFADIGSHWCDLAEFVTGHRITRLAARMTTAVPERPRSSSRKAFESGNGSGEVRAVETEDAAIVQFETDRGAIGTTVISQISAGRKNRLWLEVDGAEEALTFDQEHPETLWRGRREATTIVHRDPQWLSPPAARLATLPPGHPEGYAHCFDRFVEDVYATIADGTAPDGLPTVADGLRAALITDTVLRASREQRWLDVPTAASVEVTR
jgi:predicted dehydrogenase